VHIFYIQFFHAYFLCAYFDVQVPVGDYTIPLGVGKIVRQGKDVTLVGWGGQILVLMKAAEAAEKLGIQCEVIDLRSLLPWDEDIVVKSAMKTGRVIVSHEAPVCHAMLFYVIIIIIIIYEAVYLQL
jgi:2-oxoisovalerate dehydrogenase E1 component beta subunit